ncbi:protein of unknown function [Candidatus Methylopumilus planktonicus]|uniref:Uncharacterized protein n=1 Tax=Candidatus Methylopumilus planktonicus TaxID=1581557 RepID=A0A0D6EUV6_9PROT|nr:protein of unknown function [Candidatus Methylopumilus planktonicus]
MYNVYNYMILNMIKFDSKTLNPFVASSTLASPTTNISFFLIISIKI